MELNKPTLVWARQHHTGQVWHDSAALTKAVAGHWPEADEDEDEKDHQWGEVRLFRMTIEPVSSEEQDAYFAEQEAFFAKRRAQREQK